MGFHFPSIIEFHRSNIISDEIYCLGFCIWQCTLNLKLDIVSQENEGEGSLPWDRFSLVFDLVQGGNIAFLENRLERFEAGTAAFSIRAILLF